MNKRLARSSTDRKISGVCGGIAQYLNIDPTIIRIAFILTIFAGGFGLLLYIIAALIMPMDYEAYGEYRENKNYYNSEKSSEFVPEENTDQNNTDNTADNDNYTNTKTDTEYYEADKNDQIKKTGLSAASIIGIILIAIGAICMINIFFPAFDFGAVVALIVIALGVLIIVKGGK